MIRVQIVCLRCDTIVDGTVSARKLQVLTAAMTELHSGLDCFADKEESRGQDEEGPDREEARPDEPGGEPTGTAGEGGAAPGARGEREGRA